MIKEKIDRNFIRKEEENDKGLNIVGNLQNYLCPEIRRIVSSLDEEIKIRLEEIRMRVNQPMMIHSNNQDYFVSEDGRVLSTPERAICVTRKNIDNTLQFAANYSIYSVEEEIKNGYITIQGGHRIGIVGKVVRDGKGIKTMKDFTGLNIRISREKKGVSLPLIPHLISDKKEFLNTLIVSPPQCGKTTLLRDIIHNVSQGVQHLGFNGVKVGVVDERSEIGACFQGVPQNDLGPRTDILDACPKAEGMMMLIRAMSPNIIATDEIGREEDDMAVEEALMAGIKLITTVHGRSLEDILHKRVIGELIQRKVFQRIVFLSNRRGVGTVESILDGNTLQDIMIIPISKRGVG